MSTSTLATVKDQNPKVAPTLTQGKITPEILYQWERLCKEYFRVKAISEKTLVVTNILHKTYGKCVTW